MKSSFGIGKLCNFYFLLSYLKVCVSVRSEGRNQVVCQDILVHLAACNTGSRHYITENSAWLYDFSLLEQYFNFFLSQFPNQFFVRYSLIYFECIFSTPSPPPQKALVFILHSRCKMYKFHASSVILLTLQAHWITKMFIKYENSNHQEKW